MCEDASSKPEDRFGDDVLLDLVGATIVRGLAGVEIGWRDRTGSFRSDRRLVPTLVVIVRGLVGHRIGADDFQQQVARRLLDPSPHLEDRRGRVGLVAARLRSAATNRNWVISSALSSTSTAASFSRKRSSSISGLSPSRSVAASSLIRRMRSFEKPTRAIRCARGRAGTSRSPSPCSPRRRGSRPELRRRRRTPR